MSCFVLRAEPYQALFRFSNSAPFALSLPAPDLLAGSASQTLSEPLSLLQLGAIRAFRQISSCFSALSFPTLAESFSLSQFRAIRAFLLKVRDFIASVLEDFIGSRFQLQFRVQPRLSDKSNIYTRTAQDNQSTVLRVSIV
ncbi:hypothetical protein OG984_00005 [Nocardioides sp. NBC_00368]|uniref:hypothetical protein n=1 Tax=Nocardioides sp. NBC_00368 TaxID=2976000 RepID=UPI002E2517C0